MSHTLFTNVLKATLAQHRLLHSASNASHSAAKIDQSFPRIVTLHGKHMTTEQKKLRAYCTLQNGSVARFCLLLCLRYLPAWLRQQQQVRSSEYQSAASSGRSQDACGSSSAGNSPSLHGSSSARLDSSDRSSVQLLLESKLIGPTKPGSHLPEMETCLQEPFLPRPYPRSSQLWDPCLTNFTGSDDKGMRPGLPCPNLPQEVALFMA